MKRLVLSIILGFLLLSGTGLVIIITNLYILQRHFHDNLLVIESLNARLKVYEDSLRLIEAIGNKRPEGELALIVEGIKNDLSSCNRCHSGADPVIKKVEGLQKGMERALTEKSELPLFIGSLESFSRMAIEKARFSFMLRSSEFKASFDTIRIIFLLTFLAGGGIILAFSLYSLRRVTSLEKDIKEKEKTITDWALAWQETFDSVRDMIIILDKEGRPVQFNLSAGEFF